MNQRVLNYGIVIPGQKNEALWLSDEYAPMKFLDRATDLTEWNHAWDAIKKEFGDYSCENPENGECWQYMGSHPAMPVDPAVITDHANRLVRPMRAIVVDMVRRVENRRWIHSFRHRSFRNNGRQYVVVVASETFHAENLFDLAEVDVGIRFEFPEVVPGFPEVNDDNDLPTIPRVVVNKPSTGAHWVEAADAVEKLKAILSILLPPAEKRYFEVIDSTEEMPF